MDWTIGKSLQNLAKAGRFHYPVNMRKFCLFGLGSCVEYPKFVSIKPYKHVMNVKQKQ